MSSYPITCEDRGAVEGKTGGLSASNDKRIDTISYTGTLAFNICAFILPALYGTLSKL
jgi:hypothetical protein